MLLLVGYLIKLHEASLNRAFKRLFACVYSQMVEEVVPFPEQLLAPLIVTGEDLCQPFAYVWATVLYNGKGSGRGYMHSSFKLRHVDILSVKDFEVSVVGYSEGGLDSFLQILSSIAFLLAMGEFSEVVGATDSRILIVAGGVYLGKRHL
jgi:hypothetical protein